MEVKVQSFTGHFSCIAIFLKEICFLNCIICTWVTTSIIGLTKTDLTSPLSINLKTKMVNIPKHVDKICVHTGNILNLNEVKKNAGQNSSEEVRLNKILRQSYLILAYH